ncbi:MAG: RNA polymerase factor sigma-54, partial [Burkholderiaceae bacterium]
DNVAAEAIKTRIRQLITAENPAKPLSDNKISDLLAKESIGVARRTVAKYREAMRIAPANLRKDL